MISKIARTIGRFFTLFFGPGSTKQAPDSASDSTASGDAPDAASSAATASSVDAASSAATASSADPNQPRNLTTSVMTLVIGALLGTVITGLVVWAVGSDEPAEAATAADVVTATVTTTTAPPPTTTTTTAPPPTTIPQASVAPNDSDADSADDSPKPRSSVTRDGVYLVGNDEDSDIVPGRYVAQGEGSLCYLSVTSDATGNLESIERTHFGDAFGRRVELEEGQFFETDACGDWVLEEAAN